VTGIFSRRAQLHEEEEDCEYHLLLDELPKKIIPYFIRE
jgi:hypothetical protein